MKSFKRMRIEESSISFGQPGPHHRHSRTSTDRMPPQNPSLHSSLLYQQQYMQQHPHPHQSLQAHHPSQQQQQQQQHSTRQNYSSSQQPQQQQHGHHDRPHFSTEEYPPTKKIRETYEYSDN